ncbi:MAG: AAA family ATPase [Synechococcaceae cyanobacterium SM2_3_2]|nr:AAA family ATPase [Synechococcaceae cyanobacterium SM2_3_2]
MLAFRSHLITGTRDLDLWPTPSAPVVVAALQVYLAAHHPQLETQALALPDRLEEANWGSLWQQWQQLSVGLLSYSGSIADPVGSRQTLADMAADWGIPIILTVPAERWATAQVNAYAALVQQSGAVLRGLIMVSHPSDQELPKAIEGIPVLGSLDLLKTTEAELCLQAKDWDWEWLNTY